MDRETRCRLVLVTVRRPMFYPRSRLMFRLQRAVADGNAIAP